MEIKSMVPPWQVKNIKHISKDSYILRFRRNNLKFKPGQHLVAGPENTGDLREYSIYSGIHDDYLELLVRKVEEGKVSKAFPDMNENDRLTIDGPHGFFMYNAQDYTFKKLFFIASGTGIAPFHSFAKSYPKANYKILHGIKYGEEQYGKEDYKPDSYISCTSRDNKGDFQGRVTDYLNINNIDPDSLIYLCGNSQMIHDSISLLKAQGIPESRIFTEIYF